ncbi:toprim domain-containing protein [Pseudomonas sp. S 311-6]|nr:toprim domain-containing protein [Pseudomonas sp. S 311-6]
MANRIELIRTLNNAGLKIDGLESGRLIRCKNDSDKGSQKSGWYRVFDNTDLMTCVYGDWRTGKRNVWVSGGNKPQTPEQRANTKCLIERAQQERLQEQARQWVVNRNRLMALWNSATPITNNDPAGRYLSNRGLTVPITRALRFHTGLEFWHEGHCIGTFAAMLAAVTSPTDELVTIHRTYITPDGRKASVPTVKKLCSPAGVMGGASIKIAPPITRSDGRLGIGIAEGIETALAAAIRFGLPVWAGVSAHGLASFAPPPSVRNVYVFADNDANQTGQKAAAHLARRLTLQGFTARIHIPPTIGDWNDELIARGATT